MRHFLVINQYQFAGSSNGGRTSSLRRRVSWFESKSRSTALVRVSETHKNEKNTNQQERIRNVPYSWS